MKQPYNSVIADQPYRKRTILPTCDINAIRAILGRDNIYDTMSYDDSPSLNEYAPTGLWFVLFADKQIAGAINLEQLNNVMWQAHIAIYPEFRGHDSEEWGILAAQYIAERGAKKILAITPYESAKRYAERVGFINVGVLSSSIRKNGKLLNQWLLELGV